MIANSLFLTVVVVLVIGFWLMGELKFLVPFKSILYHQYGGIILAWIGIFFVNVFAAVYALHRKFFLKDTGRKLLHLEPKETPVNHDRVRKISTEMCSLLDLQASIMRNGASGSLTTMSDGERDEYTRRNDRLRQLCKELSAMV